MMKLPTDRQILQAVFDRYRQQFLAFDPDKPDRKTKIYVPIDCQTIGSALKTDAEIVFGRLYYHLERKHGYEKDDGTLVPFFTRDIGKEDCVNFPLMCSVLAGLQEDFDKHRWSLGMSIGSLVLSIVAIIVAALTA